MHNRISGTVTDSESGSSDASSAGVALLSGAGATRMIAVATSAVRDAEDGPALLEHAHALGIPLEVIDGETESDFFVLMRAWRHAEQSGYQMDRCRRLGVNAQAARQVGPLFEQFLRIAAEEGLDGSRCRAALSVSWISRSSW